MRKNYNSALLFLVCVFSFILISSAGNRAIGQCVSGGTQNPTGTLNPTLVWQTAATTIRAGQYTLFNVTAGNIYLFSFCPADGGACSFDSQLTLFDNTVLGTPIAYSDDECGDDAKITWIATFTGVARVKTNVWNCATNTVNSTLRFKFIAPCNLSAPANSVTESEPCGSDLNGGCNSVSQSDYEPITCGTPVFGTAWATTQLRDTDWFLALNNIAGTATWTVQPEFPAFIAFVDISDCNAPALISSALVDPCSTVTISMAATAGQFVVPFIALSAFVDWPCGNGWNDYIATLNLPNTAATATPVGPITICQGQTTTLTASSGNSYLWSPGGATTQSITVGASGSYSATVTNANGCRSVTNTVVVNVSTVPVPTITPAGSAAICQGGSVTLTSSPGNTYLWSPGGQVTQSISVSAAGSYSVTVSNGPGCTGTSQTPTVVTVNPLPIPSITPSGPTTFCQGGSVVLSGSPASSYLWTPGNAVTSSINATATGTYVLRVTDANGCSATTSTNVTVNSAPVASISASGPLSFCQGGTVTLTASGGASWLWSNNATTQSITVNASGTFSVTVTGANGCSATSSATNVIVSPLPTATITPSGPTTFCAGGSVSLTSSPGLSYLWSNNLTAQTINVTTSGNYSVTVSNGGCSATSVPVAVTVNPPPSSVITPSGSLTFCQGGSVTLTAPSALGNFWIPSGQTSQAINVNSSGTVVLRVVDANGCSSASAPMTITVNPLPVATATPSGNTTFCQGKRYDCGWRRKHLRLVERPGECNDYADGFR